MNLSESWFPVSLLSRESFGENPVQSFVKRALHSGSSLIAVEQDNGNIYLLVTGGLLSLRAIALNLPPSCGRRANLSEGFGRGTESGSECPGEGTLSP